MWDYSVRGQESEPALSRSSGQAVPSWSYHVVLSPLHETGVASAGEKEKVCRWTNFSIQMTPRPGTSRLPYLNVNRSELWHAALPSELKPVFTLSPLIGIHSQTGRRRQVHCDCFLNSFLTLGTVISAPAWRVVSEIRKCLFSTPGVWLQTLRSQPATLSGLMALPWFYWVSHKSYSHDLGSRVKG